MPSIVQFFHPGKEHGYDKTISKNGLFLKDWNTTDHKRKFLLSEGSYVKDDKKYDGKLLFWGEWEPPSRVELLRRQTECPPYGKNPEYLHIPFLPPANDIMKYQSKHIYQNTDPFVFGNYFIYAICRQKNKYLRTLKEGSLIIFGSKVNHRFVIDTVFVVKYAKKYSSLEDIEKMNLGIYQEIVSKFILNKNNRIEKPE